jgi:ABC-type dipeptide/oligopeptide/nickel transport system permease component
MVLYLLGRLSGIVVVFLIVSVLAFFLMHSVPGGPFDETNQPLPPAAKANILRKYGLDRPIYEQYFNYMGNALQGDFGISFQSPTETVIQLITRAWPTSMQLGGLAILLAFIIGLSSGILAAVHQNTWVDYVVTFVSTLGITVPNFVIRTARAKGLMEMAVVLRHALKNGLIPLITILGPQIPNLITGTIFVEVIFRVPGLGKFFVSSIYLRDYPMIMATMLLVATLWSFTYLASDLLYTAVDPRVRLFGRGT